MELLLNSIEQKVSLLLSERHQLKEHIKQLENRIEELNTIINQQRENISQLENMQFVQSFTGLLPQNGSTLARKRLNSLLSDIDKCIDMIND